MKTKYLLILSVIGWLPHDSTRLDYYSFYTHDKNFFLTYCYSLEGSTMINQSDNYSYYYYNQTEPKMYMRNSLDLVFAVLAIILSILGLFLNACTIAIIIRGDNFGKGIKIQLINLAVADILCSLATVALKASNCLEGFLLMLQLCRVLELFNPLVFLARLISNTAISLERFVAVYFPLKMREYRRRHVITVIIAIWMISALLKIFWSLTNNVYVHHYANPELPCMSKIYLPPTKGRIASYVGFVCLPVLIIVTCYTLICIKLKRRKVIGEQHRSNYSSVNIQVNKT